MSETTKKKSWIGEEVDVLEGTYEPGKPDFMDTFAQKLTTRKEMLAYIETAERYWYAKEGFGSEKRKTPA